MRAMFVIVPALGVAAVAYLVASCLFIHDFALGSAIGLGVAMVCVGMAGTSTSEIERKAMEGRS